MQKHEVRVYGEDNICVALRFTPEASDFHLAFAEPYTYQRYLDLVASVNEELGISVKKEILCYSLENRPVYVLSITAENPHEEPEQILVQKNPLILPHKEPKTL